MSNFDGWQGAATFSAGSLFLLVIRIIFLIFIARFFQEIPSLIVASTVFLPAFCVFTALGFHRDFYKSYIPHEIKNLKEVYSIYVSIVSMWLGVCILLFMLGSILFGQDLYISLIISILIFTDRIQDEKMRLYFFTKNFLPWFLINTFRTVFPITISLAIWNLPSIIQLLIVLIYLLISLFIFIPKVFYKNFRLPNIKYFYNAFGKQGIYSLASQLRRNLDRLLAIPILGAEIAFTYNILVQLASGSVLAFEKFINVLERQSYLMRNKDRIKINRLPFFVIGTFGILIFAHFYEKAQAIQYIYVILVLLCSFCWLISLSDREFEYNWWKGNIAAYKGSIISILLSTLMSVSIYAFYDFFNIILIWYVCAFLFVPLITLFWIQKNGVAGRE